MKEYARKYDPILLKRYLGVSMTVLSFLWFYFPGEYALIANQDLSLFILKPEYLFSFLDRPGGLLEYTGGFLSQFLRFRFVGALLLAGIVLAGYYLTVRLAARISGNKELLIPGLLSSVLMVGMFNYYPHQVAHSLGFILAMALVAITPGEGKRKWVFLVFAAPLFYLLSGGYLWFFCGLILVEEIVWNRKTDYVTVLLCLLYPVLLLIGGGSLHYLNPLQELFVIQLPFGDSYGASPWPILFVAWIVVYVILAGKSTGFGQWKPVWKIGSQSILFLAVLILVMHFSYNRKNAEFFQIEKRALSEDWEGVLEYTDQNPSRNLFGSFYTNLALVNRGRLCTDLFSYPQSFGRRGLCFEWDAKGEILRRGSDFFWTVHFVNEAHHWAYESMVIDGFTRRNLRRLIQTELVRGNFKIAEKYIDHLGTALFHKSMAEHYRQFLNNRQAIVMDPELGSRLGIPMDHDFFAEGFDLEKNLRLLVSNNPSNLQALEYQMALLLLEKRVDEIATLLPAYLKASGGKMPVLLDESLLVYRITHPEDSLVNIPVSNPTMERFKAYSQVLRQYRNPQDAARMLYPSYQSTFWFHLNFSSLTQN